MKFLSIINKNFKFLKAILIKDNDAIFEYITNSIFYEANFVLVQIIECICILSLFLLVLIGTLICLESNLFTEQVIKYFKITATIFFVSLCLCSIIIIFDFYEDAKIHNLPLNISDEFLIKIIYKYNITSGHQYEEFLYKRAVAVSYLLPEKMFTKKQKIIIKNNMELLFNSDLELFKF